MKKLFLFCALAFTAYSQGNGCDEAFRSLDAMGIFETGLASGTAHFMDTVKESSLGKILSRCSELADRAYDGILEAGQDALKKQESVSYLVQEKVSILLTIYGQNLSQRNLSKLKDFLRLRPWKLGFYTAAAIAVDALLAHEKDPSRDTTYHDYDPDQMEAVFEKYLK